MFCPIPLRKIALSLGCVGILVGILVVRGFHEPRFDLTQQTGVDDAAVCSVCALPAVAGIVAVFIPRLPAYVHSCLEEVSALLPWHEVLLSPVVRGPPMCQINDCIAA